MANKQLHCASCRLPVAHFINQVYYPGCHHVFCEACFILGRLGESTFLCPVEYMSVASQAEDSPWFYSALRNWYSSSTEDEREKAWAALKPCINFMLFPCRLPKDHEGYDSCPYDHSIASRPVEVQQVCTPYCEHCHVKVASDLCPRCKATCTYRILPQTRSRRSTVGSK